ncbi:TULIP family P47-like protein [Deinococcus sp. HMF7604]|uniref:TULIP family P47-like protein n=1 Tax=Deinococcus betulae TaxID=2873312 RepID=UPI001CCF94B1|nr:TULIP family P47-like protein [Deinococcus betulae]MBZ9753463.1 TULIP family P47-like protein [Deinococcus betulae]
MYHLGERTSVPTGTRIEIINTHHRPKNPQLVLSDPEPFQTNNWDTVFAASYSQMNESIRQGSSAYPENYPTQWAATISPSRVSAGYSGAGSFEPWTLYPVKGESGTTLTMAWHIPLCSIQYVDGTVDYKNLIAYVKLSLQALASSAKAQADQGDTYHYMVDATATPTTPLLTISSVLSGDEEAIDPDDAKAIGNLLVAWANDKNNLQQFKHVFATVTLDTQKSDSAFQWLVPSASAYAYASTDQFDTSSFAVLGMVNQRPIPPNAVPQVNAGSIPTGQQACYSLSQEMLMTQMLLPSLHLQFSEANASTFIYNNDQLTLTPNTTLKIGTTKVGAINYDMIMQQFTVKINATQLEVYAFVHVPISPGIDAYIESTSYYHLKLIENAKGEQAITYVQAQDPFQKSWSVVADWVTVAEEVAGIILSVAGAAIGAATGAAEATIQRLIVGLMVGGVVTAVVDVIAQTPVWIAGDVPATVPPITSLFLNATNAYTWSPTDQDQSGQHTGQIFQLTDVSLNGAFQMSGVMVPAPTS